jgi:hypothetical protein
MIDASCAVHRFLAGCRLRNRSIRFDEVDAAGAVSEGVGLMPLMPRSKATSRAGLQHPEEVWNTFS